MIIKKGLREFRRKLVPITRSSLSQQHGRNQQEQYRVDNSERSRRIQMPLFRIVVRSRVFGQVGLSGRWTKTTEFTIVKLIVVKPLKLNVYKNSKSLL